MKMTRQHFQFIADQLAETRPIRPRPALPEHNPGLEMSWQRWLHVVGQFATELQRTNPRFDRARFETACAAHRPNLD